MICTLWTLGKRLAFLCLCVQLGVVSVANCQNFHPSYQALQWNDSRIQFRWKIAPLFHLNFVVWIFNFLDHSLVSRSYRCSHDIPEQPGRTGGMSHGLGEELTAECPGQHTHPVSHFSACTCFAPVRADDLPTQVNEKLPCNPSWDFTGMQSD